MIAPSGGDPEGRELFQHLLAVFFARDEEVRHRFIVGGRAAPGRRRRSSATGSSPLTPAEADELGRKLFAVVDELAPAGRSRRGEQTLVSVSVLPALEP